MISKKTVLILGAGSAPKGFPLGSELYWDIVGFHSGNRRDDVVGQLEKFGITYQDFESFRQALELSGKESVDEFLEHRREFLDVGKKSIAAFLIPQERHNVLFARSDPSWENWYRYLFRQMNSSFDDFSSNNVVFITFNYDRSLEYFLFHSLMNSYGKKEEEVVNVLKGIPIIHIHGNLGEPHFFNPEGRDYKPVVDPETIEKAAKKIYIVHDDSTLSERLETQESRRNIKEAQRIFFLGFGWNERNLRRLGFPNIGSNPQVVGGTCFKMSTAEIRNIKKIFETGNLTFTPINMKNLSALRESGILI